MGLPALDLSPTAHPSKLASRNSGRASKKATTSGLFHQVKCLGHSKETVPPSFKTSSALLEKLFNRRLDSLNLHANLRVKAAPPLLRFIYCRGEPEVQGMDDHK